MDIIGLLHNQFLEEAVNSPMLLNDLSNMEKYIAESYSGRSLIELIQNADDAESKRFLYKSINNNCFLIANDGRVFNENDLRSLCRSGVSTKKRSNNNIGYRGIGFKSVVNYSEIVHVNSGEIKTTFSKELTKMELTNFSSIPLLRIPHNYQGNKYNSIINNLKNEGYTTFFVFETFNSIINDEIKNFDNSCMLFLNNVEEISFEEEKNKKTYLTKKNKLDENIEKIKYVGDEDCEWLIVNKPDNNCTKLAFKCIDGKAVPTTQSENVIHSFMPTTTKIDIPLKINANFSTDPSRTKVVMDDETEIAINQVAELIESIIEKIIDNKEDSYGFIKILTQAKLDPLRSIKGNSLSDYIIERYINSAKHFIAEYYKNSFYQESITTDESFYKICNIQNINGIGNIEESNISGIIELAKMLGIKPLPLDLILKTMEIEILDFDTRLSILQKVIDKSRFGFDSRLMQLFYNAKIINFDSGIQSINSVDKNDKVTDSFKGAILEKYGSLTEIEWFFKKINLKITDEKIDLKKNEIVKKGNMSLKANPTIKKWRSVEENVTSILKSMDGVKDAIDVAKSNLGYDIDLLLEDGTHEYYEVKSVSYLGDSFTMTNNEFSSAIQYKEKYNLAIVNCQNDKISLCIINDPTNTLQMSKRVTRWEWYCTSYDGEIIDYKI